MDLQITINDNFEEWPVIRLPFSILLCLTLVLALPACGPASPGDTEVAGVWQIDRSATLEALKKSSPSESDPETMMRRRMLEEGGIDLTISFHRDGTAILVDPAVKMADIGTWAQKEGIVTIRYSRKPGGPIRSVSGALRGEHMHVREGEEPPLVLAKNKAVALSDPPPPGPLRKKCDPSAANRGEAGNEDIVGLSVGMTYDEVIAALECREDIRVVQTAGLWVSKNNYGVETKGVVRATSGIPCAEHEAPACDTAGKRFPAVRNATTEYFVVFTGLPGEEVARIIWRRSLFDESASPAVSVLTAALTEKYGPPQIQAIGNHTRLNRPRPGTTNLVWLRDVKGQLMLEPKTQFTVAARNFEQCVNGPNPVFTMRQSWSNGCGLTVRAEIAPHPGNQLLARELNMVVLHQSDFFNANRQFQHALKLRGEEQIRKQGGAVPPKL